MILFPTTESYQVAPGEKIKPGDPVGFNERRQLVRLPTAQDGAAKLPENVEFTRAGQVRMSGDDYRRIAPHLRVVK